MPGFGLNQAPRQSGTNTGMDENGLVMPVNDGFTYPITSAVIRVTIQANQSFRTVGCNGRQFYPLKKRFGCLLRDDLEDAWLMIETGTGINCLISGHHRNKII